MSNDNFGVPMPDWIKKKGEDKIIQIKDPEKITALRIIDRYRKMFDHMDFSPVDDLISFEELENAYINYNWPKIFVEEVNAIYCQKVIQKYDASKKNKLNFVEFTKYMEDLWENIDTHNSEMVKHAFMVSKNIFHKLFHWLDRDNDTKIQLSDMIFGISRVMLKDSNVKEVKNVFAIYDPKKTGKISQEDFVLAIINGYLKETLSDQKISDSFIKQG
jgi:Ca2+-binding EF-hand superfamily protein